MQIMSVGIKRCTTISPMREMEEENRKRPLFDGSSEFSDKRQRTPAKSEDTEISDDDEIMPWLSIDDETVTELSKLLETEITSPVKVKFIDNPYSLPEIFQSSPSSFITINGNEESCGSSYSDTDSSVMASIDLSGINREAVVGWFSSGAWDGEAKEGVAGWLSCGAWDSAAEEVRGWTDKVMDGSDCCDEYDDEMLAKFIGEEFFESE